MLNATCYFHGQHSNWVGPNINGDCYCGYCVQEASRPEQDPVSLVYTNHRNKPPSEGPFSLGSTIATSTLP